MLGVFNMSINQLAGLITRLVFLFFLLSCEHNSNEKTNVGKLALELDTLTINIEEYQLSDYPIASILESDSIVFFYGYNTPLHQMDVFSLSDQELVEIIPLSSEGPNALAEPFDVFVQNSDSIFFYGSDYSLDLLNSDGIIVRENLLKMLSLSSNRKTGFLSDPLSYKLYFDPRSVSLFFHSYSMESIPNMSSYYKLPILAEIVIPTGQIKEYPFYFSEDYLVEGYYLGEYMNPNIVVSDSLIIFSFPNSPTINVYDRSLGQLSIKKSIESRYSKNTVEYMPSQTYSEIHLRLNHLIANPYFYKTVYDPYRKLFYRTHRGEHPNPDLNSGNLNFSFTRDYLTVMDENLNLLEEIELPIHKFDASSFFVTKDGLHFPFSHYLNDEVSEEKLIFHVYKFAKIDSD